MGIDRRLFASAAAVFALLVTLPATVLAECNGPACGDVEQGIDALGVVLLIALLTLFVMVMTLAGRVIRRDRR